MYNSVPPIRFVCVDDNVLDLLAIQEYCKAYPFLKYCGSFSNAMEALEAQRSIKPDLIFLDVEMPGFDGLHLLREVRKQVPMAVFITSYPEYAMDGFELSALDFILKPLTEDRFEETIRKVQEYWEMRHKSALYDVIFEKEVLTIKEGYNQIRVAQRDIIYLEAMQDYTKIVTPGKNYLTLSTLSFFMEQLPADRFMRVHRSFGVSIGQIKELNSSRLVCGTAHIPVGKTYRSQVAKLKL